MAAPLENSVILSSEDDSLAVGSFASQHHNKKSPSQQVEVDSSQKNNIKITTTTTTTAQQQQQSLNGNNGTMFNMPDYIETFWPTASGTTTNNNTRPTSCITVNNSTTWSPATSAAFTPTPLFESPVDSTFSSNVDDTFQNFMLGAFDRDRWVDAADFTTQSCPVARLLGGYGENGGATSSSPVPPSNKQLDATPMSAFIQQLEEDAAADLVASLLRQTNSRQPSANPPIPATTTTGTWPQLGGLVPDDQQAAGENDQPPIAATVSKTEEEGRKSSSSTLSREPSIAELRGRVLALAKVQYGSRLLQRLLARGSHIELILAETLEELPALMTDAYGNYLCQQLFEVCSPSQRRQILTRLGPSAAQIAEDRRGTHSMQALIGLVADENEELLLLEGMLRSDILALSTHPHATHVIQRALTACGLRVKSMIFEPVIQRLSDVARTPHGICVVKRCISAASTDAGCEVFRAPLLKKLTAAAVPLIQSPYGNYAVQHALDAFGPELCRPILRQVWDNFLMLSTQKFSSNVVEKSIAVSSDADVSKLLRLATEPQVLKALLASSYGSFVIQKLLTRVEDDEAERVLGLLINSNVELAHKRIRAKFERLLCSLAERLRYNGDALVAVAANSSAAGTTANNSLSETSTNNNNTGIMQQNSNESISRETFPLSYYGGSSRQQQQGNNSLQQQQQPSGGGWLTFRTGTASTSATNSPPPSEWDSQAEAWKRTNNRLAPTTNTNQQTTAGGSTAWSPQPQNNNNTDQQPQRRGGRGKRWRGGRRGGNNIATGGVNKSQDTNNLLSSGESRFDLKGIIEA